MKCNICGIEDVSKFYECKPSRCVDCIAIVSSQYYSNNKEKVRQKAEDRWASVAEFIDGYKIDPCFDCGKTFPSYCMDFDHVDPTDKAFEISEASAKLGRATIHNEILKCQIVCACCLKVRQFARSFLKSQPGAKTSGGIRRTDMKISGNTISFGDFSVTFHRTLRLPEDGQVHNLPPSLGSFPIKRVEDYAGKVPKSWLDHGGVFIPMFQREAMWLSFNSTPGKHHAIKIAAGKVNAVSGKPWSTELQPSTNVHGKDPEQDYMVNPGQPWLDGFNTGDNIIRQFIAMPLGMGYTVEGQVTGKEEFGGLQLMVMPSKPGAIPEPVHSPASRYSGQGFFGSGNIILKSAGAALPGAYSNITYTSNNSSGQTFDSCAITKSFNSSDESSRGVELNCVADTSSVYLAAALPAAAEMGLAQGGKMQQKIYADPHGVEVWDQSAAQKVFIHIVNSEMYSQITGEATPPSPITPSVYKQYNYPWFKLYDEGVPVVEGSGTLAGVKPVSEMDAQHGFKNQQDDSPLKEMNIKTVPNTPPKSFVDKHTIKDGKW